MQVYLGRALPERTYLLVVALAAVMVSISMTIPFASILIGAVLLRHERWKEVVAVSSLGSATGGLILYSIFYYLGLGSDRRCIPGPDRLKGMVRCDWMDIGLRGLGSVRCRRNALASNSCSYLHCNAAVTSFRSVSCAAWWQIAEIWSLRVACCQLSIAPTLYA